MIRFLAFLLLLLIAPAAHAQQGFYNGGLNTCSLSGPPVSPYAQICYGYMSGTPTFFLQEAAGGVLPLNFSVLPGGPAALSISYTGAVSLALGQIGTLTGTLAARPANGAMPNTALLSDSGLAWFGAATFRAYTNAFSNQTTWLGSEQNSNWQAADTYAQVEIISTPGSGIALAAATRSMDNTASQSYTFYNYAESDGSYNGGSNKSAENNYDYCWNRHDSGITTGSHYCIGLEIDTQNEEVLQNQGSYALGFGSWTSDLWLVCGGDFAHYRASSLQPCPIAAGILSQDVADGALFSKGFVFAQNSFLYNHGYQSDEGIIMEMPQYGMLSWVVPTTGAIAGVIGSVAGTSGNPMDILFTNTGLSITNSLETNAFTLTPNGAAVFTTSMSALVGGGIGGPTNAGAFFVINGQSGSSKVVVAESQGATVAQFGATGATSGTNTGDDFYIDAYSDAGVSAAAVNTGGSGFTGTSGTLTWAGSGCDTNPVLNVTAAGGIVTAVSSVGTAGRCTTLPASAGTTWTAGGGLSGGSGASFTLTATSTFLYHDEDCVRAVGMCVFPQGIIVGGNIATNATIGFLNAPYSAGTPSGTPSLPVSAASIEINSTSKTLNVYVPSVGWYHAALTAGAN